MRDAAKRLLRHVKREMDEAGVFGPTEIVGDILKCAAADSTEPAWYCLQAEGDRWHVSLVTHDRWLSESIETDLLHRGDPIEELIDDELVELGYRSDPLPVRHFRSDDLLYTFRSPVPLDSPKDGEAARLAAWCLLAYEAVFRRLGDMQTEEAEERELARKYLDGDR